jgi:hypothetical protein
MPLLAKSLGRSGRVPNWETREIIAVVPAVASQKTTGVVLGVGDDEKVRHHPSTFATPFQVGAKHGSSQESAGMGRSGEG